MYILSEKKQRSCGIGSSIFLFSFLIIVGASVTTIYPQVIHPIEKIELYGIRPRHDILLLGTFHFADQGLDDYVPKFKLDVLSNERQSEITGLIRSLARYRPTSIALEWPAVDQASLNSEYQKFLRGEIPLSANERHQVGFRQAKLLGHQRVFAVDAPARWYDKSVSTEILIQRARQNYHLELLRSGEKWASAFEELYKNDDELKTQIGIPQFLAYLNSPKRVRLALSRYLVGEIEVGGAGDYIGADTRSAWYNRNIRIFSNIQRISIDDSHRIMVIIGQAHVPILRHLADNSPQFKVVEAAPYIVPKLKATRARGRQIPAKKTTGK